MLGFVGLWPASTHVLAAVGARDLPQRAVVLLVPEDVAAAWRQQSTRAESGATPKLTHHRFEWPVWSDVEPPA